MLKKSSKKFKIAKENALQKKYSKIFSPNWITVELYHLNVHKITLLTIPNMPELQFFLG